MMQMQGYSEPKFPGWESVGDQIRNADHLNRSARHPVPQDYLGIERQKVQKDDILERRRRYIVMWTAMKSERSRQWDKWRDLADYVMPEQGRFLTSDHNVPKNTDRIINNTPTRFARSLAAGLLAGHTSPSRPWLNLTVSDPDLAEWGPMKKALWELNRRIRLIYEVSGFYRAMAMGVYPGLGTFGLGTCIAEEDFEKVMRWTPLAIGTYAIAGDGRGKINRLQTEEAWTVAELVREFGWENCSRSVRVAYNGGWYEQHVAVLRTIAPNEEFIPGSVGVRGARWGSVHMEIGGLMSASAALSQPSSDPVIGFLRESKYNEFPVLAARWMTTARDVYPTGPGHDALNDTKMLMQLEKRKLLAISKGVNPAMLIPDVLRQSRLSMLPGDAVYYPTGSTNAEIKSAYDVKPEWVAQTREEIQLCAERIGQAFFADLMLLFSNQNPADGKQPDSAQEVVAKQQEKMLMLGPVLENINEFLTTGVERALGIMSRRRLMPRFPREARDARLKVEFISPLAQAQKLVGAQSKERLVQFIGQVAQIDQRVLVKFNGLKAVDRYANDLGTEPDLLLDDAETAQALQKLDQEKQAQQRAQSLLTASEAAKSLGKVPMDTDNMVTRLAGAVPAAQQEAA